LGEIKRGRDPSHMPQAHQDCLRRHSERLQTETR